MSQVLAFSGGADSTALHYALKERGEDFRALFTPTGNELPELYEHVARVVGDTGVELILLENRSLEEWIEFYGALPNDRQRWCTRLLKIVPCVAWLQANPGHTLLVGLRADEEARVGLYGELATYRYPLREWGWTRRDVLKFLRDREIEVPLRTDCAWCPYQRLYEWQGLLKKHPEVYRRGEAWEARTGHTFRSPSRDTWPASLKELREAFESGRPLRKSRKQEEACRVCRF